MMRTYEPIGRLRYLMFRAEALAEELSEEDERAGGVFAWVDRFEAAMARIEALWLAGGESVEAAALLVEALEAGFNRLTATGHRRTYH